MKSKLVVGAVAVGVLSAPLATVALVERAEFGHGVGVSTGGGGVSGPTRSSDGLPAPVPPPAPASMLQQQIAEKIAREYAGEHPRQAGPSVGVTSVGADMFPAPAMLPGAAAPDPVS